MIWLCPGWEAQTRQSDRPVDQHGGFSSLWSHLSLSGSFSAIVKVKGRLQRLFLIHGVCTIPSTDAALWLFYLCSLSGLPHSVPVQDKQVYQCRPRRPRQLISSSPLSDELAVETAWLRGKVANFPTAFQVRLMTLCVRLSECLCLCSALHP